MGVTQALASENSYELAAAAYISKNVYFDDKKMMIQTLDFDNLCRQLSFKPIYRQSYRVFRNNEIHYYSMKAVSDGGQYIYLRFTCEDEEHTSRQAQEHFYRDNTGKRKILVVEDNAINRAFVCDALEDDYECIEAENGAVALRLLEDHCYELSLVLLDLHMPVMDGMEFLEYVRRDPLLSNIPVVVMTSDRQPDTEEKCMQLGAVEFLEKGCNVTVMLGRIRNIIRIRENAAEMRSVEFDELTGLYTRQAFTHYATRMIQNHPEESFTMLVTNIKDFKLINSMYGETSADHALQVIAEVMRRYGNTELCVLARYSSDRFVGLYASSFLPDDEALNTLLQDESKDTALQALTIHVGVYRNIDTSLPLSRICDRAISALNAVKHSHTHRVGVYDNALSEKHRMEHEMEAVFEAALQNGEFMPWFQPKIDPVNHNIVGAEALVRWERPDGVFTLPSLFIPLFEKDGYIVQLDRFVFRAVCELQADHMRKGEPLLPISVNMSQPTLYHPGTLEEYSAIVQRTGIPISCVPIEITESAPLQNPQIISLIFKLKDAGFTLHMDDFGSGYSSLTSLGLLPFDVIKLDKSLINTMSTEKGQTIIRLTIQIAHELGMTAVSEGVETADQLNFLRSQHCDAIQGFYYAKPMPLEEFKTYLASIPQ